MMKKAIAFVELLLRFLLAVVLSGIQTVKVILRNSFGTGPSAAGVFVRLRFAPMNEQGAAILGCMITLTPGTTTIDIDMDRHELLLHVLDGSDLPGMIEGIERDFESSLVVLFGVRS